MRPYRAAVLTHIALLDLDRFDFAFVEEAPALIHRVAILGMRELLHRHADQLAFVIGEHLAQALVDVHEAPIQSDLRQPGTGELERAAVAFLALAQRGLGVPLRGDVGEARHHAVPVGRLVVTQEPGVDRKPCVRAARALDADDVARQRLAGAHHDPGRPIVGQHGAAIRMDARQHRREAGRAHDFRERQAEDALGRLVAGDDLELAVVHEDALVRRVDDGAPAFLVLAQRRLGVGARGDVDDRADQPGDFAARVGIRGLVVDRVAQLAVGRAHPDLIILPPGMRVQLAVHLGVALGDRRILRIEVAHLLADERLALEAEKFFPRPIDAEVAAVAALEKHRHSEGVDELERCVERGRRLLLPPCPF